VFRSALPEGKDNVMCAVKIILIQALRSGNASGKTIGQVLTNAKKRADRTIVWPFPNRPVLCGANDHKVLDWDKLALRQKATRALIRANNILGSSMKVNMHLLRYGVAEDLQSVRPTGPAGHAMESISNQLAHRPLARMKGVGLVYAQAYTTEDHWEVSDPSKSRGVLYTFAF